MILFSFYNNFIWTIEFSYHFDKCFTSSQTGMLLLQTLSSISTWDVLLTYPLGRISPCNEILIKSWHITRCLMILLRHKSLPFVLLHQITFKLLSLRSWRTIVLASESSFPSKCSVTKSIVFRYSLFLAAIARDLLGVNLCK